ncbi:PAS/PAC sensor hybrid histidine kinase [Desulfovibrio sp. X2]|uniref:hybrid sensor histidine kinase/response regulator n=1 Tax=Desulfovibrio sp. X2 TaxID=941449 RepID=UPI00035879A1|nr:response regulator [Desulfovibrio sp. X2]EPR44141.1 PAS/PAC sensor hybrid histidine kinase [Desulfovibrio sp. X2]
MPQAIPHTYRILAVDDEEAILGLYRDILCLETEGARLLEALGGGEGGGGQDQAAHVFDLSLCTGAEEAVDTVRRALDESDPFSVALIDVRLRGTQDGIEAAARIRALDPGIEIVMVTGFADVSLAELNRRVAPPEKLLYLQKPFKPQELRQLALSLCTKWHAERQYQDLNTILWETVEERTAELGRANEQLKQELAERVQVLERLKRSEERYRLLFDEDITGNFVTGADGRVVACNEAFAIIFGYKTPDEALGFAVQDVQFDVLDGVSLFDALAQGRTLRNIETAYRREDGERIWLIASFNGVEDEDGVIVEIRGYFYDITERKKLEEQLRLAQKMEALGTLAGGIAHDFNNILGVILGYAEIVLEDAQQGTSLERRLHAIVTAGQRARDLVQQILNFSRQGGQEKKPLHVVPLVKEALKLLRSSLSANIEIRQRIETEDDLVAADPTQLHQILLNLCTNAAHAMREGGGLLEVTVADESVDADMARTMPGVRPGAYLRLSVRDSGHGIAPDLVDRIFDPFFTTKRPGEGTGMGLAVVHGIVRSHEGTVKVESEPGEGTVFHVLLPKTDRAAEAEAELPPVSPQAGGRVLFVDDEPALVEIGREMLESLGYEVEGHVDAPEALRSLTADPGRFDLLVTDQNMPRLTGLELAERATKLRPGLPVILCTGFSDAVSPESMRAAGVRDLLMKPLLKRRLAESLNKLAEG